MNGSLSLNRAAQRTSASAGRVRERIIEVILEQPAAAPLTAYEVSKLCQCTPPYAYAYLDKLSRARLVEGTAVREAPALFEYWLKIREEPRVVEFFVPNPMSLFVPSPDLEYAVTTYVGESVTQGYLSPARWDIYLVEEDLGAWSTHLRSHGALRGRGNFRLLVADPWIARHPSARLSGVDADGGRTPLRTVPDPRLVVDLLAEGAVAVEGAKLLMERRGWAPRTRRAKRA